MVKLLESNKGRVGEAKMLEIPAKNKVNSSCSE